MAFKLGTNGSLGDSVIFCSLPENYYLATGKKLIDLEKSYLFDHNPFVERDKPWTEEVNLWRRFMGVPDAPTMAQKICSMFGIRCALNHPRLYRYEDSIQTYKSLAIHTTGKSVGAMPQNIINFIRERFHDRWIYQVGAQTDVSVGYCFDKRGHSFWETAKTISEAEVFIGIDSGPMWLAQCYPRTHSKIILINKTEQELEKFLPLPQNGWIPVGCEYYNCSKRDIGVTKSYLKI